MRTVGSHALKKFAGGSGGADEAWDRGHDNEHSVTAGDSPGGAMRYVVSENHLLASPPTTPFNG